MRKVLSASSYAEGILNQDRVILSKAITLVESSLPEHRVIAEELLELINDATGKAIRIGITGVPGVGKSTFIESFGTHLTSQGLKVAVLTIDPTSQKTRGSILGDKTRMEKLSVDPNAFIRPSASGDSLGGVAHKTRETMLLCEAAGFDIILIETVGVGQSEVAVKNMTDLFLLLMLAGAGDELQGIKRGIMEMADIVAITKADGENKDMANMAKLEYMNALHLLPPSDSKWIPTVETCSALDETGIDDIWTKVNEYFEHIKSNNYLTENRENQLQHWFKEHLQEALLYDFFTHPEVDKALPQWKKQIEAGTSISKVVNNLIEIYKNRS